MRRLVLSFIVLGYFNFSNSQIISVQVTNCNYAPLIGASATYIDSKNVFRGSITDDNGTLRLNLFDIFDSIFISYQGYKTKKVSKRDLVDNMKMILDTAIYILPEFITKQPKILGTLKLGICEKKNNNDHLINFKGNYEAICFSNPDTSFEFIINKIYLGIWNSKKCPVNIEIKLFSLNDEGKPKDELLSDKIIVNSAITNSDLLTVNVGELHIYIPPTGLAIAVQLIKISDCENKNYTGLKILYQPNINSWSFALNKKWYKSNFNNIEPVIGLSLLKIKN